VLTEGLCDVAIMTQTLEQALRTMAADPCVQRHRNPRLPGPDRDAPSAERPPVTWVAGGRFHAQRSSHERVPPAASVDPPT
jgi:hypothetical protein